MADQDTFPNLIRQYFDAGEVDNIITLCTVMKEQRDRAEYKLQVFTHMNAKLKESFSNITEPATGRKVTERETATFKPQGTVLRTRLKTEEKPKSSGPDVSDFTF